MAAFGSLYLGLAGSGAQSADHAFAVTGVALGVTALLAAAMASRATRSADPAELR